MASFHRALIFPRVVLLTAFLLLPAFTGEAYGQVSENAPVSEPSLTEAGEALVPVADEFPPQFKLQPDVPIVVELFSSQACIFCPQADRLFGDLVRQPSIIGIACHIDYFDVRVGSLSQPFCTARQSWYVERLGTGPNYTPQIVMQGNIDVVGYRMEDVVAGLQKAARQETIRLDVAADNESSFTVSLPEWAGALPHPSKVWLIKYDKPHKLQISAGRNAGQRMSYFNVASAQKELEPWEGLTTNITAQLQDSHAGFVVLVQNSVTGRVIAAGDYRVKAKPANPDKTDPD